MSRIVYLNGVFLPESEAKLPIFDRGLLFADAVYEGLGVLDGQIIDFQAHMGRLRRSLGELSMPEPMSQDEFFARLMRLIEANDLREGFLYLHITRGVAERDYIYAKNLVPTVFAFTQAHDPSLADSPPMAVKMQSTPDLRWARRDIKTSNLLGQVMAKQIAFEAGADEALMIAPDGFVTEGGCSSFFMIKSGTILARPVSNDILNGITRRSMLAIARVEGVTIEERHFTLAEVYEADEAFITGASSYLEPVGAVDGRVIGKGEAGPLTLKLRQEYLREARAGFYKPG